MKILLFLWLFISTTLLANQAESAEFDNSTLKEENTLIEAPHELQKVLYLNYEKVPYRVLKGEIFTVTIKTLSTVKNFLDISYSLSNSKGLKLLNNAPSREVESKYYHETFYFIATSEDASLPDFTARLVDKGSTQYAPTTLSGEKLNVISLNPKKDFSNIVANSFEIVEYKTTNYDSTRNIVVFVAVANNCDISSLKLNGVYKQGIESINESQIDSKIIYYAIIDKKIENLSFSYFSLIKNSFISVDIPIIVSDDSVTTQSDIKPKDQSNEIIKMSVAAFVAFIAFIMILWKKSYFYLIFIITPLAYIVYIGTPSKDVCIKSGTKIHLLPVHNGTVFETTSKEYNLQKQDFIKGWIKIELEDQKIGWVKNEDICSH